LVAFARVRELLGAADLMFAAAEVPTVGALWEKLTADVPQLDALRASTRSARNGAIVDDAATLHDGDEVALLPPVGGG
jgi:molybdopterin converting factor small subunit